MLELTPDMLPPEVKAISMWLLAALGLCFGSFVTAVSYRLPRGNDFVQGRSFCPECKHPLGVKDLIPVVSWVSSGGRCRYCKTKISYRYPLIELTQMLVFVWVHYVYGFSSKALLLQFFSVCLMIMIVVDLDFKIIPDKLQFVMALMAMTYWYLESTLSIKEVAIAITVVLTMSLSLRAFFSWWKKREALGLGDVKFFVIVAIFLGLMPIPFFFFLSGIIGVVFGLIWRVVKKDVEFPFGPALAIALFVNLLYPDLHYQFIEIVSLR